MNTNQQNIRFNYYAIECLNIINSIDEKDSLTQISASFKGRMNNPNIIYSDNNLTVNYQATNIYINEKIHSISNFSSQDGEIVILHRPTTTSLKLYACFPFKGSTKNSKTDIDKFIDTESYSLSNVYQEEPLLIEINKYIGHIPSVREYQTLDVDGQQCIVLVFENVIKINRCLDGKKLTKALFVASLEKPVVSTIEDKLKTPSILMEGFHEAMDDKKDSIKDTTDTINSDVVYKCEYLPVDTEDMVQVLQVPIGSPGYNKEVGNQVSGVFVSNSIFIFVVLVIFFISPLLYGFIESLLMSHLFLDNIVFIKTHLKTDVNLLNLLLIMVFSVLTIILLIYGLIASNGTAIAISIFIPFCSLISYVSITFFRKSGINELN